MARPVRGCLMPQSQQECAGKSETNVSISQQGGHGDIARGEAIADYDLDIDYKPEGSDPKLKQSMNMRRTLMQNM